MALATLPQRGGSVAELVSAARNYADASRSTNTHRAYAAGWKDFDTFCRQNALQSFPADSQTVALWLTSRAQASAVATLRQRLAAIGSYHRERGFADPTKNEHISRILRGVICTKGSSQRRKAALDLDLLRAVLLEIPDTPKGKRDKALILLGFAAALRRSELAALNVDDVRFEKRGLVVRIRKSKTDQEQVGCELAVPHAPNGSLCPVRALRAWIEYAGLCDGALFRSFDLGRNMTDRRISGQDVALLLKRLTKRAGLSGDFSGHSLRSGFATAAAKARVPLDAIARTTRHKSLSVLMGYVRPAQIFDDVALSQIFAPRVGAA